MTLIRKIFTNNSTIGCLTFDDFKCWMLEPPARRIEGNPICIPRGSFKLRIRPNAETRFNYDAIELLDVPGRTDILIHIGNSLKDTLGCLLPGSEHKVDWVSNSTETYNKLFPLVQKAIEEEKGDFYLNIV